MSERDNPVTERPFMPGYGIEPSAAGLLSWGWAEDRLTAARHFWVATRGPDGAPHLAAVWGVWAGGALYFSTGGASRKARNLTTEPRCAVTTGDGAESLVLEGVAHRLTDPAEIVAVHTAYVAKYGEGFPDPAENPLYAVVPVAAFGLAEAAFTSSATRWTF